MLYPLKFKPCFKAYPYGGRRFAELLKKDELPHEGALAESWEIADRGPEQSVVANGALRGKTLREMMQQFGAELVGAEVFEKYGDYFPLLLKFLDCEKRLPAHLHPSDEDAARIGLQDCGKTEAWYIVRADTGAMAYIGALPGLTPEKFAAAIEEGDAYDGVMNKVPTQSGQTYFVPAGRLHGIGGGNLAFEVQQNSDAGFGWDWAGFVEAGIIPAEEAARHPQLAIECASYENGVQEHTKPVMVREQNAERTFCCACKYFVLEEWKLSGSLRFHDKMARFNTFTLIEGAATVSGSGEKVPLKTGESLLVPAGMEVEIVPEKKKKEKETATLLRCYVPELQRDVIEVLRRSGKSDLEIAWLGSYGKGNDLLPLLGLPPGGFSL